MAPQRFLPARPRASMAGMRRLLPFFVLVALACGEAGVDAGDSRGAEDPGDGLGGCLRDADCPDGLACNREGVCVADDGLPPEEEDPRAAVRPEASADHLFVLAPAADAVTLIDPDTLEVESVPVPAEPVDLEVIPGEDAALVLSREGRALSLLTLQGGVRALEVLPTGRRYGAVSLAPDGRFAILWTPDGAIPDAGAEGIVAVVDVAAWRAGETAPLRELAAGRRHTAVHFRGGSDAVIVGKSELAVIALDAGDPLAERVALPAGFDEVLTREALAAPDGSFLLLRSLAAPELAVFDVAARNLSALPLPAPATDLDVSADGSLAVAVLRSTGQVATLPLPGALADPGSIAFATVALPGSACETPGCTVAPGQVALSPDGALAVLFSNAAPTESFALFTPASGSWEVFGGLEKWVRSIGLSTDGRSAVVIHRPDPASTAADLYERQVDQAEGYTVIDLDRGVGQLKLTGALVPQQVVFATGGRYAAVALRGATSRDFGLDAIDLETLVTAPLPLASAPEFAGPLPAATEEQAHRIWVTQEHPAGRIGVARLDQRTLRTITGFELNAEVR